MTILLAGEGDILRQIGRRDKQSGRVSWSLMRPIRETLPIDEARALVFDALPPVTRTERVPINLAGGRVAAADVVSAVDVPPFNRAGMDGYAVIAEDTFGAGRYEPRVLRALETIYTGETPKSAIAQGECA